MNTEEAYNSWATQYDTNHNRTRDLEAVSLKAALENIAFSNCLEMGCGTGKNTAWLISKADHITAVDLSEEMLAKARTKISAEKVSFIQADMLQDWHFAGNTTFDLVTFSLVLEHIEDLQTIFEKLRRVVADNGYVYVGELHPFKQYNGSKARFETENGTQVVPCFTHHLSDFTIAAQQNGFAIADIQEYFDDDNRENIPRILALLFRKR
ncbi:MAG: class I SAM-dependent methyltransferase [Ferruginibacter sp.]